MAVEKYYSQLTVACQNKQHNNPRRHTHNMSHLLHLHHLDLSAPAAPLLAIYF